MYKESLHFYPHLKYNMIKAFDNNLSHNLYNATKLCNTVPPQA